MIDPDFVMEVRVAGCWLCASTRAVRGVTTILPTIGGMHLCGSCLLSMVRMLVTVAATPKAST